MDALADQYGLERIRLVIAVELDSLSVNGRISDDSVIYRLVENLRVSESFYGGFHLRVRPEDLASLFTEIAGR